jgi:putative transposase
MRFSRTRLSGNTIHMRYAQYVNKRQGMCGHLWQRRFYSCILDEKHLFAAVRYIENNPVRAGLVKEPEEYPWSSAQGHIHHGGDYILCKKSFLYHDINNRSLYLKANTDSDVTEELRAKTKLGRPYGEDGFMTKLEKKHSVNETQTRQAKEINISARIQ